MALIEARDREERALQQRMALGDREAITERVVDTPAVEASKQEAAACPAHPAGHLPSASDTYQASQAPPAKPGPWDHPTPMSDEPQAWTPRAIRRG